MEHEWCRFCTAKCKKVVTKCPSEESEEKMNKILEMGEQKKSQNKSPDMVFEVKLEFKPIVSEMCTLEEINRYFSQKSPGDIIQGTLGNQFGVRYMSHDLESVKVQLIFKDSEVKQLFDNYEDTTPGTSGTPFGVRYINHTSETVTIQLVSKSFFDWYKVVMIPAMYVGKPQSIAYIHFSLVELPEPVCDIHANADKAWANSSGYSDVPQLVDIADEDLNWVNDLDQEIQINLYKKLCEIGVPYLV
jgi:hypothetical protein